MTSITEYSPTEAALADLRARYAAVVYDVTTSTGIAAARLARAELRDLRVSLEKTRKEIKEPALRRCQLIDSEAKRITAELVALEDPIDQQIKAEEQRKQREREDAERRERERLAALNARLEAIRTRPQAALNAEPDAIRALLAAAEAEDPATFPDPLQDTARMAREQAIAALRAALERAEVAAAERAELARLRAEQAAVQAERARLEQARAEQERQEREAAERAEREAREAVERAEREARAAERARLAEERRLLAEHQRQAAEAQAQAQAAEREQAIASATLHSAAAEALALLQAEGYADHLVTHKLAAALGRDRALHAARAPRQLSIGGA